MTRGTTPTLTFTLPFDIGLLQAVWVTFSQDNNVVINRELDSCECSDNNKISVHLTQQETLMLNSDLSTQIQVRCRTQDDEALVSQIISVKTGRILRDGVI